MLRNLLILGRASNLPGIWSNCLAGWWLGGDRTVAHLPFILAGATFLYLGGAFLNDAFDADYDRQHRRARPIPAGYASAKAVLGWAIGWLLAGVVLLFLTDLNTGIWGMALAVAIVVFNVVHRVLTFSAVLLGGCRWLLYLVAGSAAEYGVTGWSFWGGLVLAAYVTALASVEDPETRWTVILLASPLVLSWVMNVNEYREGGFLLSAVLGLWILRSLRYTLWSSEPDPIRTRRGLMAGIIFVDWLAIVDAPKELSVVLIGLFLVTLSLQRLMPVVMKEE